MSTTTLEFESGRFLESLFIGDRSLLKEASEFFGCRLVARDSNLILDSEDPEIVDSVRHHFDGLEQARRAGIEITPAAFRQVMESGSADSLTALATYKLLGSSQKPPVSPRNQKQLAYLQAMDSSDVVFGLGSAGTGKTYLAMARAIVAVQEKEVNRIILTRPAVEAGEALGFLPGDLQEKLAPYLRPLYDALYDMLDPERVEKMIDRGLIEIAPLAYMRGRTLSKAFVILDEAQNTTSEQMLMFLTRIGYGSRCVVTGDPTQIDLKGGRRNSGLTVASRILQGIEGVNFVEFDRSDVVRHPVVQRIIGAYEMHSAQTEQHPRTAPTPIEPQEGDWRPES